MSQKLERMFSDQDIRRFADLTGDCNPVHLDEEYASASMFGRRIAHGMLSASLFSTILGTRLPGKGAIYISQSLKFIKPVFIGDVVVAEVTVLSVDCVRRRVHLRTAASVNGSLVVDGEAAMFLPKVSS